jgi:hypothetical protein
MRQRWLFLLLLCQPNGGVPGGNGCLALGVGWVFLNSRLPWVCPFTYWCRCQLSIVNAAFVGGDAGRGGMLLRAGEDGRGALGGGEFSRNCHYRMRD